MFPLPSRIFCSIGPAVEPQRSQRYRRRYLVDSVFPAPDSPDTMMLWDCFNTFMSLNALSPAKIKEELALHSHRIKNGGEKQRKKKKKKNKDIARTYGEDVWRCLTQGFPLISFDSPRRVEVLYLVIRIHGYQNVSDVSL